jgi:hypothetical protein
MEVVEGEIVGMERHRTVEDVNNLALDRLYELIQKADAEQMPDLVECLSKYNTSIRNNTVFTPRESEEERTSREQADIISDSLK